MMLEHDIKSVYSWLNANKLTLNVVKTELMIVGSQQRLATHPQNIDININDIFIQQVNEAKCLGLKIDDHLTWKDHVEKIKKKITTNLRVMKNAKPYINNRHLINIYNSIVRPHFDYCCTVWDSIDQTLGDQLQKLQNRAARIITGLPYSIHTCDIFNELGWHSLAHNRKVQKAIMMHKIINGHAPSYLSEMFEKQLGKIITI